MLKAKLCIAAATIVPAIVTPSTAAVKPLISTGEFAAYQAATTYGYTATCSVVCTNENGQRVCRQVTCSGSVWARTEAEAKVRAELQARAEASRQGVVTSVTVSISGSW